MTDSPRWREDEPAIEIALFRYGIIAPILELDPALALPGQVVALVQEIAGRPHYLPSRGRVTVSPRTVFAWLADFRRYGIEGLRPTWRQDRGQRRVVSDKVIDRAIVLRKENSRRKTRYLIDIMKREGTLSGEPSFHRATLDRHLFFCGASRRQMKVLGEPPTIKMEFDAFGDLWVGDYHHGPPALAPDGSVVTAKIGAVIDHKTRYPVANRYYANEVLDTLRDGLLLALLRWGPPKVVYVDRGAVYRSNQLSYSLKRLDVQLVHSRPYYSKGRGVIERWWQLLKDFESEVVRLGRLLTIHELNTLWEAFRETHYCHQVHSELGCTPAQAIAQVTPRGLDPELARELFLVREKRQVHRETSCVSVKKREFLCEQYLRQQWVDVRFDPNDLSSVLIFKEDRRLQRAFPRVINAPPQKPAAPEQVASSVDYLGLLRADYDRQLLEHARPLAYAKLEVEAGFDENAFVTVVASLSGLVLRPPEKREISLDFHAGEKANILADVTIPEANRPAPNVASWAVRRGPRQRIWCINQQADGSCHANVPRRRHESSVVIARKGSSENLELQRMEASWGHDTCHELA